jgi:hypothetical protein
MVYDLYKLCTNDLKMTVYHAVCTNAPYQPYMHFKATLIVTYDLILTLFDYNIRICFEILA